MERIILFGTGCFGNKLYKYLQTKDIAPIYFADNEQSKWGSLIDGIEVIDPRQITDVSFDAVVICVSDLYYDQIYAQLIQDFAIPKEKILHWTYWQRLSFLDYYSEKSFEDKEIEGIVRYVESRDRLKAFNYAFADDYDNSVDCYYDSECELFYALYHGKKLYLNKRLNKKELAEKYVQSLLIEQDDKSPHRYLDKSFSFDGGCLLDAGVAEGNFALDNVEKAERIVLIEADADWNDALLKTFEPWKDKVVITNKYLSDKDSDTTITIDAIFEQYKIDFIKMDIEGAEVSAIEGGKKSIQENETLKMAICTYHNLDDESKIRKLMIELGYKVETSNGYMVFPDNMEQQPRLVRGLIRTHK